MVNLKDNRRRALTAILAPEAVSLENLKADSLGKRDSFGLHSGGYKSGLNSCLETPVAASNGKTRSAGTLRASQLPITG